MRAGWRYIVGWRGLFAVLILAMIINFVTVPAFSLMPILVTEHFGGGATQLGWLESAWGIGVVVGGLLLSVWGGFRRKIYTSLSGVIVSGIGMTMLGLVPAGLYAGAVILFFFIGVTNPIINGPFFALLQSRVEPDMQGRVMSLVGSATAAMMPLSLIVAGPLADKFGVSTWYVFGGIMTLIVGLVALTIPVIVGIEENGHPRPVTVETAEDCASHQRKREKTPGRASMRTPSRGQ